MPKQILHFAIALCYWTIKWGFSQLKRTVGGKLAGTCVVLYYHGVTAEERARFARQMDELLRWARPAPADLKEPVERGVHCAVLTFHDGHANVVENALPELAQRGIPATLFVPTNYIGQTPGWIDDAGYPYFQEVIVSIDQLRSLHRELVSVGSHGVTHRNLTLLSEKEAREELCTSKLELEAIVGYPVRLFAFPYGAHNEALMELASQCGYERVFTCLPNVARGGGEEFVTGAVEASPTDWMLDFRLKVLGAYGWLPSAIALKRKVRSFLRKLFRPTTEATSAEARQNAVH